MIIKKNLFLSRAVVECGHVGIGMAVKRRHQKNSDHHGKTIITLCQNVCMANNQWSKLPYKGYTDSLTQPPTRSLVAHCTVYIYGMVNIIHDDDANTT